MCQAVGAEAALSSASQRIGKALPQALRCSGDLSTILSKPCVADYSRQYILRDIEAVGVSRDATFIGNFCHPQNDVHYHTSGSRSSTERADEGLYRGDYLGTGKC